MKDCDSRRSWIGGEGLPSRDQVKEKREQRLPQVGFSQVKPQESCVVQFSYKIFVHVHGHQWRQVCICGCTLRKVTYIHLKKACRSGSYNRSNFCQVCLQLYFSQWAIIPVMGALILA
jgi:hypothetical protein